MDDKAQLLSNDQQQQYQQGYAPVYPQPQGFAPASYEQPIPQQHHNQPQTYQQAPSTIHVMSKHFSPLPESHVCQWCGVQSITRTEYSPGTLTFLASGAVCLFGLWAGCCLIPFCIDELKDVDHYCPSCRQLVGKYTRI